MTAEFQLIYPALIASAWFLIQSFRHRHRSGFCRACGYDLTGIVSGVCPECGIAKPTPQDVKLRRASRKKRLKTVTKWTSGIALGTSLALWWFAANYDFYLPTSGGSNGIEAADGVVSIRVMIPFWWEAPDFSSCDLWKSDGRWGWSLPNWRREGGDQSGAWTAQYVGDMPMWLPTAFLTLSTALLWKWSFRRRILPG